MTANTYSTTVHDWLINHGEYRPIASHKVWFIGPFVTYRVVEAVGTGSRFSEGLTFQRRRTIRWAGFRRP